ncbi:MAG: hypothetical protein PF487_03580 [Bacteroidales bacterium]|jgi:methyl-accepting chemotaxis protein|nr:hypothetical protein [Bacteroidales bacterium]
MKIKFKILTGFLLLIIMLLIAGVMSIYEFSRIGKSVRALIDDNYKTIEASKTMIEALEREDSGILLLISGKWKEGRQILQSADSLFLSAFDIAKNNLTEKDEDIYIEKIETSYLIFKNRWEPPIVGTSKENSVNWYFTEVHINFIKVKSEINALMTLNQDSMYLEASELKEQAHRAIMPGIVAIVSALIFLVMFNFFIGLILVRPIKKLINSVKGYYLHSQNFDAEISNHDELKELEIEIQNLISRIHQKNEK